MQKRIWKSKLCLFLGFVLAFGAAQSNDANEIATYMEAWQATERFTGAVLVAQKDEIVFEHGYGLADVATERPNTHNTAFRLGSLSKPLTATAILQLQDEGLLHIDDPISTYLPDYPNGDAITLHDLLTHTSGIPDYARAPDYPRYMNTQTTLSELIDKLESLPLMFPPGTQFSYSNSNYVLLSAVIEAVSGHEYGAYMQKHVFSPAGMTSSSYNALEDAKGYRLSDDGYVPASPIDLSVTAGAGGLSSTVGDLYSWIRTLQEGTLLREDTLATMTRPAVPAGATGSGERAFYGLGWYISTYSGHRVITHNGGVNGFSSDLLWFPDDETIIIVLSNLDVSPVVEVAKGIAAIVFDKVYSLPEVYTEVRLASEVLAKYVGRYALGPDLAVTVELENDYLYLEPDQGSKARLYPFSDTEFFLKVADVTLEFVSQDGAVKGFLWRQGGREVQAVRLEF